MKTSPESEQKRNVNHQWKNSRKIFCILKLDWRENTEQAEIRDTGRVRSWRLGEASLLNLCPPGIFFFSPFHAGHWTQGFHLSAITWEFLPNLQEQRLTTSSRSHPEFIVPKYAILSICFYLWDPRLYKVLTSILSARRRCATWGTGRMSFILL
jgi:hypothetical protein